MAGWSSAKTSAFRTQPGFDQNSPNFASNTTMAPNKPVKPHLKPCEKMAMYLEMVQQEGLGGFRKGFWADLARRWRVSRPSVYDVWTKGKTQREEGKTVTIQTFTPKKGNRGAPIKWDREAIKEEVKTIPFAKRTSDTALAALLGIPKSTIQVMRAQGILKRYKSYLKPTLKDEHRIKRIGYCLSMRDPGDPTKYRDMYDRVHVDEKWFHLTKDGRGRAHV